MSNVTLAKIFGLILGIAVAIFVTRLLDVYILFLLALIGGIVAGVLVYRFVVSIVATRSR